MVAASNHRTASSADFVSFGALESSKHRWTPIALLLFAIMGCSLQQEALEFPDADRREFATDVYPVLLANCAFSTCHGDAIRPFAVFGPGRRRLDPDLDVYAPVTADEVAFSYARARSMLIDPEGPRRAPLLRKPLAVAAGGAKHEGDDPWGGAVFESKTDPRYEVLFFWAIGEDAR